MGRASLILHLKRWQETRELVALRAQYHCENCNARAFLTGHRRGECDHKIPRRELIASGGNVFDMGNLQWLCQPCHARKSALERHARRQAEAAANPDPNPQKPRADRLRARSRVSGRKQFLIAAGLSAADVVH